MEKQRNISDEKNKETVGKVFEVIIEGISKKSDKMLFGRTDGNKTVIIPLNDAKPGDKIMVRVNKANSATLFGEAVTVN